MPPHVHTPASCLLPPASCPPTCTCLPPASCPPPLLLRCAWELSGPLNIYGTGANKIPMIHVADLAAYLLAVANSCPDMQYLLAVRVCVWGGAGAGGGRGACKCCVYPLCMSWGMGANPATPYTHEPVHEACTPGS